MNVHGSIHLTATGPVCYIRYIAINYYEKADVKKLIVDKSINDVCKIGKVVKNFTAQCVLPNIAAYPPSDNHNYLFALLNSLENLKKAAKTAVFH